MRELATLSDVHQAQLFSAYLFAQNIPVEVEQEDGRWVVWIQNDDDRPRAQQHLAEFLQDPGHERYQTAARRVRAAVQEARRLEAVRQNQQRRLQQRWQGSWWYRFPATCIIIGMCIVVALICTDLRNPQPADLGLLSLCNDRDSWLLEKLWILDEQTQFDDEQRFLRRCRQWEEQDVGHPIEGNVVDPTQVPYWQRTLIRMQTSAESMQMLLASGQYWRVLTPALIHLSLLHILMNMACLKALGGFIEMQRGTRRYLVISLVLAAGSNLVQFFWSGPGFGGYSGVIFGLVGYAWMLGVTRPQLGVAIRQEAIIYCLFWQALCVSGLIGPIANAAHTGGFLLGMLLGGWPAIWRRLPFT